MSLKKHTFIQNPYYNYGALGDVCMQIFAYYSMTEHYNLDSKFVIQTNSIFDELWHDVLKKENIYRNFNDIPEEYKLSVVHKPTSKDISYGQWASNDLIEGLFWENAFLNTKNVTYKMPLIYNCNFNCKNVMIYPEEKTDNNNIFNSDFWISVYNDLKKNNYSVYYLGNKQKDNLQKFYDLCKFDKEYSANLSNLKECVSNCSLAIGTSTGPTWFCLFSDIRQIVYQSKSSNRYWNLDRYQFSLLKKIKTIETLDAVLRDLIFK